MEDVVKTTLICLTTCVVVRVVCRITLLTKVNRLTSLAK